MKSSGKFVLRLTPEFHRKIRSRAKAMGCSLNEYVKRSLIAKDNGDEVVSPIEAVWGAEILAIILFGSHVRGEERESSDVDLLLILDDGVAVERDLYRVWDKEVAPVLGDKYSPQFSRLPKETDRVSSLWLEVALEGHILYEKDPRVRKRLTELKGKIASGHYLRKFSHGHPYWVRRSNAKS